MPNLNHIAGEGGQWFREDRSPLFQTLLSDVKQIISYPLSLHHKGYEEVERFMKERIDENGTLYSYATASFYMIYALLALGHSLHSSLIQKAIAGITSYIWKMEEGVTCKTLLRPYGIQLYSAMRYKRPTFQKHHKMIQQTITYLLKTAYKKLIGAYMLPHLPRWLGFFGCKYDNSRCR